MSYDYASLSFDELTQTCLEMGLPKYRATQIFRNISRAIPLSEMTDLSKQLRESLSEKGTLFIPVAEDHLLSADGTEKFLFRLEDGNLIETVIMKYKHGNSVCISSQVGCLMGCKFCASTLRGKVRNLTAGEMLMQVAVANKAVGISNIVIMGIGEPLDNYDNVVKFLRNVNDERGLNIGARHISLSTCGIVDRLDTLADDVGQITLSVSLHAPDNATRDMLMPVNKAYPLELLIPSCRRWIEKTGRRISFEYTLVKGINDTPAHAEKLAALLRGMLCHVNLIPVNHVEERGLFPPSEKTIDSFRSVLENKNMTVTVRRTLGGDINASCGQLRYRRIKNDDSQTPERS